MSKTGKIALFSIILVVSILLLIIMLVSKYNLYLNEYNAQMQQVGYYKEDIHLLNQAVQSGLLNVGITFFIVLAIVMGISLFVAILEG